MSLSSLLYFPLTPEPPPDPSLRRAKLNAAGVIVQSCAVGTILLLAVYRNLFASRKANCSREKVGAPAKSWLEEPVWSGGESWRVVLVVSAWAGLLVGITGVGLPGVELTGVGNGECGLFLCCWTGSFSFSIFSSFGLFGGNGGA